MIFYCKYLFYLSQQNFKQFKHLTIKEVVFNVIMQIVKRKIKKVKVMIVIYSNMIKVIIFIILK